MCRRRPPVLGPSAISATELCLSGISKFCTREYRVTAMGEFGVACKCAHGLWSWLFTSASVWTERESAVWTLQYHVCFHSTSERCYLISSLPHVKIAEPREIAIRHLKNNLFDLSSRPANQHFLLRLEVIILLFSLHPQPPTLCMIHCDCFLYKNLW
jgi:hypothetical protein